MCEHARSMNEGESDAPVPVGFHYPVFSKLRELLTTLQREIKPPGEHDRDHIAYISTLLAQQTVQKEEWSQFVHFMENKYTRHLVAHDENFTVLLLCWNRNQRSPIHDHSGSSCWVRVLEGTITERRFATNGDGKGGLVEIGAADVGAGGVCYINDSQGLHEMANNQSDACTVTLHVYSPPYYYCNAFNMDGTKRQVSMLAAAAPPRQLVGMRVEPEELAQAAGPSAANPVSLVEFADILDDTEAPLERITEAFDRVWLSQAEWATYAHFSDFRFQRLLIHQNDRYSLLMLCWLPGQETPPHTHNGASSWVRVLQGTLTFTEDPSGEKRVKLLSKQSDTFAEDSNLPMHTMGNKSTEYAVSLHLYNPPYTELHYGAKAACPCPVFPHCRGTVESHECLPVVQCQRLGKGSRSSSNNTTPLATGTQPQFGENMSMLTNLAGLVDRVEAIFANSKLVNERESLSVAIMETLESTPLSTADIEKYWQTKKLNGGRIRLFENTKFNITLNLWEPGHRSVAHDHDGSMSWIKVIEGALVDIAYETTANSDEPSTKIQVVRNSTMVQDDVVFYGPSSIHAMRNKSSVKRAATLHIYFGVCNSCRWFTLRYAAKPVKVSSQTTLSDEWHIFKSARSPSPEPSLVQTLKEVVSGPGTRPANVSVPASPM